MSAKSAHDNLAKASAMLHHWITDLENQVRPIKYITDRIALPRYRELLELLNRPMTELHKQQFYIHAHVLPDCMHNTEGQL